MAWTTSAGPWANSTHMGEARTLAQLASKSFNLLDNNRKSVAIGGACSHLALVATVAPSLPHQGLAVLLLTSAILLAAGTWLAIATSPGRSRDARGTVAAPLPFAALAGPFNAATTPDMTLAPEPVVHTPLEPDKSDVVSSVAEHRSRDVARHALRPHHLAPRPNVQGKDWADLMSRVSHELRTPLNAVLGFSDLMDRGLFGPLGHHRYQEYARHIHDSGRELLKSAEDTLAVTSLLAAPCQRTSTEIIDLAELLADAWAFFGRTPSNRGITLEIDCATGTEITCDRRTMRQVLINLLSEALKRSECGTVIRSTAVCCGSRVNLDVTVASVTGHGNREPGSLHICLARTLLEFHGLHLHEFVGADDAWRVATRLERSVQADFFHA